MEEHMTEDLTDVDFFRDGRLTRDPYPFYAALRDKCPVAREARYGVAMVTGWQEAVDVYNDDSTFSSCISVSGPFPGFPVPLDGDDVTNLIAEHRDALPFNDQLPTLDPPTRSRGGDISRRLPSEDRGCRTRGYQRLLRRAGDHRSVPGARVDGSRVRGGIRRGEGQGEAPHMVRDWRGYIKYTLVNESTQRPLFLWRRRTQRPIVRDGYGPSA